MERKWRALLIVCIAVFMLLLDITVVNVALPKIQSDLHTSLTDLQWVVDAYALLLATCVLNAGTLGDWLGRKRIFIGGIVLFTAASALCGSATSPLFLNLARGLQGVGGAVMFAVSLAILSQEFAGRERGTAFGIWGAPIGIAGVAGAAAWLHESRDEHHAGFDLSGILFLTAGLFALVLALLRGESWGWASGRTVGLFVAAAVLLPVFVGAQLREESPMFDVRLFRKPAFTGAQIVAFTISSAMFSQFLYITLYLQDYLRLSPLQAGLRFLPLSLLSFVVSPIAGRLSARMPVRILFGIGMALVGAALLLMHGITRSSHWTTLLAGFIVGGIGVGTVNAPLASTAVGVVEPRRAGMASGINNTFRQVGIATGVAGLGAIYQSHHDMIAALNAILFVGAFVAFAGAVLGLALVRDEDLVRTRQPAAA